jgi:hypothetical protein
MSEMKKKEVVQVGGLFFYHLTLYAKTTRVRVWIGSSLSKKQIERCRW